MLALEKYFRTYILDFYFSIGHGRVSLDTKTTDYKRLLVLMTKFDKIVYHLKKAIGDKEDVTDVADVTDVTDRADVADVTDVADVADRADVADVADRADVADVADVTEKEIGLAYFEIMYQFILFCRDVKRGLGEMTLTYMMLFIWYKYFPVHALSVLHLLPQWNPETFSIGSWRDIPYFCEFVRHFQGESCPLIDTCVGLMNHQLDVDMQILQNSSDKDPTISLVSKWIPRENSKRFHWLYDRFVIQWYKSFHPEFFDNIRRKEEKEKEKREKKKDSEKDSEKDSGKDSGKDSEKDSEEFRQARFQRALRKARMEYRKIVSSVCVKIGTVESKQCGRVWAQIDPRQVSFTSLSRQKNAFLNVNQQGLPRQKTRTDEDRIACREAFDTFYRGPKEAVLDSDVVRKSGIYCTKHRGVFLGSIVRDVLACEHCHSLENNSTEYHLRIWNHVCSTMPTFVGALPILDLQCGMGDNDNRNLVQWDTVGIATAIARVSSLPNRIMTFGAEKGEANCSSGCNWVSMGDSQSTVATFSGLMGMYQLARTVEDSDSDSGNLVSAVQMIVDALVNSKTASKDVGKMVFVVLSGFRGGLKRVASDHGKIHQLFADAGFVDLPFIVYWNINGSSTSLACAETRGGGGSGGSGSGGGIWTVHNQSDTGLTRGCLVAGATSTVLHALCRVNDWDKVDSYELLSMIMKQEAS
jgi:hypothetical protein